MSEKIDENDVYIPSESKDSSESSLLNKEETVADENSAQKEVKKKNIRKSLIWKSGVAICVIVVGYKLLYEPFFINKEIQSNSQNAFNSKIDSKINSKEDITTTTKSIYPGKNIEESFSKKEIEVNSYDKEFNILQKKLIDIENILDNKFSENKNLQDTVLALKNQIKKVENNFMLLLINLENKIEIGINQILDDKNNMLNNLKKRQFKVVAIIPGRAWISSDNDEVITITEGDEIYGLGKISEIDYNEYLVKTDSGKTIY